jgi:PAS domain S-box-containing protein
MVSESNADPLDEVSGLRAELEGLRAELEALRVAHAEASSRAERYRAIFDFSSEAQLLVAQGGILDCNDAAVKMLRCQDKAEVLSLHPATLSPEYQPDGRRSREKGPENDRILRERGSHRFEWVHRRRDGEDFPVQVSLSLVHLAIGPVTLVGWYDLTELQRHSSALQAQAEVVVRQQETIRRLATPVLSVGAGVLLVPVLGGLDPRRATDMIAAVLEAVSRQRAYAVVIDLTAVENFDVATAEHLVRLCTSTALLGAEAILAGITPATAQTIVALDSAALQRVRATATAGEAIARALRRQ